MKKIPKIIHYCWFGGKPLPDLALRCIESWKKFCPDYEIKEWNERNFDIHCCPYVEEAYQKKKWAFVSDFARFKALQEYGGIYFDTDIEVLKSFDPLLEHSAFFGFGRKSLTLPVFGSCAKHNCICDIITLYMKRHFVLADGTMDTTTIELTAQKVLEKYGLNMELGGKDSQMLKDDVVVYPTSYFSSTDWSTGIISKNDDLYVIHYAEGSWMDETQRRYYGIRRKSIKILGEKIGSFVGNVLFVLQTNGINAVLHKCVNKIIQVRTKK